MNQQDLFKIIGPLILSTIIGFMVGLAVDQIGTKPHVLPPPVQQSLIPSHEEEADNKPDPVDVKPTKPEEVKPSEPTPQPQAPQGKGKHKRGNR